MISDPTGRLADLARHVEAETADIIRDPMCTPLNERRATQLRRTAGDLVRLLSGYTEMPDAKRAREAVAEHEGRVCPTCDGAGVDGTNVCPTCGGNGVV